MSSEYSGQSGAVAVSDKGPEKLRVAQLIGGLSVGGAEKHFVNLVNHLSAKQLWAVFLSAPAVGVDLRDQLDPAVRTKALRVRKRTMLTDVYRLARFLRRERIDVVHTHMFWSNLYGSLAAFLARVPVVVTTEHGENHWKKAYHRWLERNVISRIAARRYCVSADILKLRRDVDQIPAEILEVVANGVIVPASRGSHWQHRAPLIGSVGRFVSQKNFGLFVDVISLLIARGMDVKACIVGDGPERPRVRERINNAGLSDVIETPGMVGNVDRWFRAFDIYLVTSSEEGQPISLLEAMSYALPVVATDVGAISATLQDRKEGLIAASGDSVALADALCEFLGDREFGANCGDHARDRVIREFSIDAIAQRYEASYTDLWARNRSSGRPHALVRQ